MKKILLIAAVALVTISASATNRKYHSKAQIAKEGKTVKATPGAFKSFAAKMEASNAFYNMTDRKTGKISGFNVQRRAGDELELLPAYSMTVYTYTSILGSEVESHFYDEASFLVTEDGKAYVAPFAGLAEVEGVLDPEAENEYAEYGAVVYKFTCDTIATYTDQTTGDKKALVLGVCDFEGSNQEGWTPVRTDAKTFLGYYFAEYNELYIPSALALFDADETVKAVFDEEYFIDGLDMELQSELDEYMSKATFSNTIYGGETDTPVTGDCVAFVGSETAIYVQGANAVGTDAWVKLAADKTVDGLLHSADYQLLGTGRWYKDNTKTDTFKGVFVTVSMAVSDGATSGWSQNGEADYNMIQNADETLTIKSTESSAAGAYVFFEEEFKDYGGIWEMQNETINILMVPVETGINAVKANAANGTAVYNLAGQKVGKDFKGIVIKDGKKYIQK